MTISEKQKKMVLLLNLMRQSNELLRQFSAVNAEAFAEIYRINSEFTDVIEDVLIRNNIIPGSDLKH